MLAVSPVIAAPKGEIVPVVVSEYDDRTVVHDFAVLEAVVTANVLFGLTPGKVVE